MNDRLVLLRRTLDWAGKSPTFQELLGKIFAQLPRVISCDQLLLLFAHADGDALVVGPVCSKGCCSHVTGARHPLSDREKEPRTVNDLEREKRSVKGSALLASFQNDGMCSLLTVPLRRGSEFLGTFALASRRSGAYSADDELFASLLAAQIAVAFDRAQLKSRISVEQQTQARLENENEQLRQILERSPAMSELIGRSPPWRKMLARIEKVAVTDASVLIRGETGTGKELVARVLHRLSARKDKPFVAVNCAALSSELISSELFGHEKGAFTGATQRRLGRLDLAQHGTLFLDEVGDLPLNVQVKLLRVLQEHEYERVGGDVTLRANVRIIAATNRDLEAARADKQFRDDLFFRLNVFPITVPPLRERKDDIELLLRHFLKRSSQRTGRAFKNLAESTLDRCISYDWPGNVRELENLVERAAIICSGDEFSLDPWLEADTQAEPLEGATLDAVIKRHLVQVLRQTNGRIYGERGAAQALGLKPSTLQAKLKKYSINRRQ